MQLCTGVISILTYIYYIKGFKCITNKEPKHDQLNKIMGGNEFQLNKVHFQANTLNIDLCAIQA
jgi:hypothetical protein